MKKIMLYFSAIVMMVLLFNCGDNQPSDETAVKKGRDIFGHSFARGLTKTTEGLSPGYIMFAPTNSPYTYLVNRKGEVVHEWKGTYGAFNPYLMDDGSVVVGEDDPDYPVFGFGGPYGRIQKISWDGKILWDFEYANEEEIIHHDFAVMPNGNILAIVYETASFDEVIAQGRKPEMTPPHGPWLEKIVELEPQGPRGAKIVWEWRLEDHLIQDFDESKANYGTPAEHPELLDFNLGMPIPPPISQDSLDVMKAMGMAERNQTTDNMGSDIFHFNAINYNPELDQIVFSSPILSEIFIIDHSTSTEEAAAHTGGKYGKGGDFLYRWGNPENYQRGDSTNRQLFGQHDVRWIEPGKPGAGNLTVFNNHPPGDFDFFKMGVTDSLNYSMVTEITPPLNENGQYVLDADASFGPEKPTWFYKASDTFSFYSPFISGAHRMHNGNTFINEGARGRFFEVTPENEVVWEYLNPYRGEIRKPNGEPNSPMFMPFSQFRATFVPEDHPALKGKELKPLDPQPKPFVMPPPPKEEQKA
jgi:hypothetical protein